MIMIMDGMILNYSCLDQVKYRIEVFFFTAEAIS